MNDRPSSSGRPLAGRFLLYYALTYIVLIALMGVFVAQATRGALIEDVEGNLEVAARLASESIPSDSSQFQAWAEAQFAAGGFRTTLIDSSGVVLGDSHSDPAVMENHADRPEVITAMSGEVGHASRISASTGFEQLYLALPPQEGLVVRVSVPTRVINDELNTVRGSIALVALVVGVLGIGLVAWLARRMARPISDLTQQSLAVASGDLQVSPRRSSVLELDQLGLAISEIAGQLGKRLSDAEQATHSLEVVLGAIPEGTILVDGEDRVVYANPPAQAILGTVPDQLGGLAPLPFQAAVRDARESREAVTRAVEHGKPVRKLKAVATPFESNDWVLLAVIDITESERAAAVRRDFVANASHELKTPVSTIIAASEAMQLALEREDPSATAFAERIENSARQLDDLVGDLLDLSRLERERPELHPVRLDLLVLDEVERIREEAESMGLALHLERERVVVAGSHRDLAVAARNLLDNAVRYTGDGGSVEVTVGVEGSDAVLTVSDTGEGIPSRDLDRVFERFYRVDTGRSRATGGTGLGLSIVRHVAVSHGGEVSVDSELGVGSTFVLRFPVLEEGSIPAGN